MTEKQTTNMKDIAFINVVLYPTDKQRSEEYIRLLSSILADRVTIRTQSSDRSTLLRTFDKHSTYYHGYFCNAIFLTGDSKTLDVKSNTLQASVGDPNKGLEAKDMEFWYYPRYHRFAVYKPHLRMIVKFLRGAFLYKLGGKEYFAINIEKSKHTIDRIIQAETLVSVSVSVRYANNDNIEDWEDLDNSLRESNTEQASLQMKSRKNSPIRVAKNKILKAFLILSKSYGTAKAQILNSDGKIENVNTRDHPNTIRVDVNSHVAENIGNYVSDIAQNKK